MFKGFFFIFKHSWVPKRSWKISHGGLEKSWIFWSVKEWEPCISLTQSLYCFGRRFFILSVYVC